jgi:hypothetical protein
MTKKLKTKTVKKTEIKKTGTHHIMRGGRCKERRRLRISRKNL